MNKKFNLSDMYEPAMACLGSAVLLSNDYSTAYYENADKIIEFICSAYGKKGLAENLKQTLLHSLSEIITVLDCRLFLSHGMTVDGADDFPQLLAQNKCRMICSFCDIANRQPADPAYHCLDYSFVRKYNPVLRYAELSYASAGGIVSVVRLVGIMQALGIGCEKNIQNAVRRLKQCAMWGDICSMRLLGSLYANEGDAHNAEIFDRLALLCVEFLKEGVTVLPDESAEGNLQEAVELYNCISSIYYDLVVRSQIQNIDLSFVEALLHTDNYKKRLEYINNYEKGLWKEETHSSVSSIPSIGFRG